MSLKLLKSLGSAGAAKVRRIVTVLLRGKFALGQLRVVDCDS